MINPSCVAQPRFDPVVPSFLQEIANAFGAIDGVEAVAWSGSSAMGAADSYSDFNFYVYAHAPVPVAAREAVIARRATEYQLNNTFWEPFVSARRAYLTHAEAPR
jgi:hypothetical protein